MAKEIDVIMAPGAIPAELKTAIDNHKKTYDVLKKAEAKSATAKTELITAQSAYGQTEAIFKEQLEKWSGK